METGPFTDEVVPSVSSFPGSISQLASRLSVLDRGPFPLCHGDFGHNNIIVDDTDHIIGVIEWETTFAEPWGIFADFPLTLSTVPLAMDAPLETTIKTALPRPPTSPRDSRTRRIVWKL